MKRLFTKVLALSAALVAGAWLWAAPPPNDNLANAQQLTGDFGAVIVNTIDATCEEAEWYGETNTVWYKWTVPAKATGPVTFTLRELDDNSPEDYYFDVYSNCTSYADLAYVSSYYGSYCLEPGQTYLIRVSTYNEPGKLALLWNRKLVKGDWKILSADGIVFRALGDLPKDFQVSDFPAGVTRIAEGAFEDTKGMKFVTIPATVKKIDDYAFAYSKNLAWVDYAGDVATVTVSDLAFKGTPYNLELPFKLILNDKVVTNIYWDAHKSMEVTNIFDVARAVKGFVGTCPAEVVLPSGIKGVLAEAFYGRGNETLAKVTFPSTLEFVGDCAFEDCTALETVVGIPAGAYVDDDAFCDSLYEAVRPFEVVTGLLVKPVEDSWDDMIWAYTQYTTNTWVTGFHGTCPEEVTIPEGIYGINSGAFAFGGRDYGCLRSIINLKKVTLPASLKKIEGSAFSYLPNLEEVEFKGKKEDVDIDGGMYYGTPAFAGTPYMQNTPIEFTYSATDYQYDGSGNLISSNLWVSGYTGYKAPATIVIPNGVYGIGWGAFQGLKGFTAVTIPASVKEISVYAFADCPDLATVTYRGKEAEIDISGSAFLRTPYSLNRPFRLLDYYTGYGVWYVLGYVGSPTKLDFSQYLTNGISAVYISTDFSNLETLKEVVLPEGAFLSGYYSSSFRNCPNLEKVRVDDKEYATNKVWLTYNFQGTPWLDTQMDFELITEDWTNVVTKVNKDWDCCMEYDKQYTEITNVSKQIVGFYGNVPASLDSTVIPEDIGRIDDWVFEDCANITNVVVPGTVKQVGYAAFWSCDNLQSVEFEDGVETLGAALFDRCGKIEQVTLPASLVVEYDDVDEHWEARWCDYTGAFFGIDGEVNVVAPRTTQFYDRGFQDGRYFGRTHVTYYTRVVLDANGGTFEGPADYRCFDDVVSGLPTPVLAGNVFREWWDEDDTYYRNGDEWNEIQPQVCLKAAWAVARKFTIYGLVGPTEIYLGIGDDYETLLRVLADMYGEYPQPSRHGLTFLNWMVDGVKLNHRTVLGANSSFGANCDKFNPLTDNPNAAVDTSAAQTYDGYLLDYKGNNAGTFQVKVGRPNKKTGEASVSAKVQMFGTPKITFKADPKGKWTIGADGATRGVTLSARNQENKFVIDISEKGVYGTYGAYDVIGSRNTSKKDEAYAKWNGKKYEVAFKTKAGTGSAFAGGYSGVTVSIGARGKVKITGMMADGGKINTSAQLLISDKGEGCVNVFVPMYTGKKGGFGFVLWIDPDLTTTHVESISTWTSTDRKAPFTAELELLDSADAAPASEMTFSLEAVPTISGATVLTDYLPKAVKTSFDQRKFTVAKANKIKADRSGTVTRSGVGRAGVTDNDAGLRLTYTARTGTFKGSFTVYTIVNSRLKKVKATVNGVFVRGVGYGSAVIKNVGSYPVTIR